jgi:hypothetical protein
VALGVENRGLERGGAVPTRIQGTLIVPIW